MRAKTGVLALTLVLALSGCAAVDYTRSLFVAGVSLEVLGDQFVRVTNQVTAGCDVDKSIPANICVKYRAFGLRFKQVYPTLVGLWQAADRAGDRSAKAKAEEVALGLATDLSALAVEALGSFGGSR